MDATLANISIIILYWQAGCTTRKWEMVKSVWKCDVKNYVRFSWVAELKMNRFNKRTDYKLEASITCCIISWKPHFRNERSKKTALKNTGRNFKRLRMEYPWLAAFQHKNSYPQSCEHFRREESRERVGLKFLQTNHI